MPSNGNKSEEGETTNPERKVSSIERYHKNQGKLILDATCAPADIRYPTDVSLLNEAREKFDDIIDIVHKNIGKPGNHALIAKSPVKPTSALSATRNLGRKLSRK